MRLAWWKIVTILLLLYTVIAGLSIPLQPSITGVSKSEISDSDTVNVYVYNGDLYDMGTASNARSNTYLRAWTVNSTNPHAIQWPAHIKVLSNQTMRLTFGAAPYFKNEPLHLVLEFHQMRDTLYNAFFYKAPSGAPEGVLAYERIKEDKKLVKSFGFPNREVLNETIRNLFFHVPIWFAMMLTAFIGMINAIRFLGDPKPVYDIRAEKNMKTAVLMGILGLLTGSLWARFTWGTWWVFDVKLNGAAIAVLLYVAYLVLRSGISDEIQRARISAVYSIFAFVLMMVFVMVVPRIYDSLHPGNGGNPAFSNYDLDSTLRMVFYPAVLAWMGLAVWITELNIRFQRIVNKENENI